MMNVRNAIIAVSLCVLVAGCGDVRDALDAGQQRVTPVVLALQKYQKAHNLYPATLDDLLADGLLTQVPALRREPGTTDVYPLRYEVSPDREFYYLFFSYSSNDLLGDIYTRYMISYENEWKTRKYPPRMNDLVAVHYGAKYRSNRDAESLNISVSNMIAGAMRGTNCVHLYQAVVMTALGQGQSREDIRMEGSLLKDVVLYKDVTGSLQYGFVFGPVSRNVLVVKDGFSPDGKSVRTIIRGTRSQVGQVDWMMIQVCK